MQANAGNFSRSGGGIALQAFDDASIQLRFLLFENNLIDASPNAVGAGLAAFTSNSTSGSFELQDATFRGNFFANFAGTNGSPAIGLDLDSSSMTVRRIGVYGNLGDPGRSQVSIQARSERRPSSPTWWSSAAPAPGSTLATANASSALVAGNLTVSANPDDGLTLFELAGSLRVQNSILFGNATGKGANLSIGLGTPDVAAENLIGIDPLFVNGPAGDLRLDRLLRRRTPAR